jgi:hypothetical protein
MKAYVSKTRHGMACLGLLLSAFAFFSTSAANCVAQEVQEAVAIVAEGFPGLEDPQLQLLNRTLRVDVALVRRVCELTEEQERYLGTIDDVWLKAELARASEVPKENAAAGLARLLGFGGPPPRPVNVQPHQVVEMVSREIDKKIKVCLNQDQAAAFKAELDARLKFRRESQAAVIVGILDKRLFLTEDQRVKLRDSIAGKLANDVAWNIYLQNENYIPTITKAAGAKVLDKEQLAALSQWRDADFEAFHWEQQMMGQQEQFVIEK